MDQREEVYGGVWNQSQCQQLAFSAFPVSLFVRFCCRNQPTASECYIFGTVSSPYTKLYFNQQYCALSFASSTTCLDILPDVFFSFFPLSSLYHHSLPSIPAFNTGQRARGAKQHLNLVSEPQLILYSFPLKEHESCSLPVVAAVSPSIRKTNGCTASVPT